MLYFREKEKEKIRAFAHREAAKAMAVFGRRRTGKTELLLDYIAGEGKGSCIYYQCTSFDYHVCLTDFINAVSAVTGSDSILSSLKTFRDVFLYLSESGHVSGTVFVIDEFPFLAKRDENVAVEFQWIIDHALKDNKLILLGSNLSFMRRQIRDSESPLYGRFDEILEIHPFTFDEVHTLFPSFEDAVDVYAQTGGVAQYVMFFLEYPSVKEATAALFFDRNGRLFFEAANLLMQEVRETTTYVSVLRAIGTGEIESGQIAGRCGMDPRNVFTYLNRLIDLELVAPVENPLDTKKANKRYKIADPFFRFHHAFIEPNISMITTLGSEASHYILNDQYHEFLGVIYEDIIRSNCFRYALDGVIPFMPKTVGKWWGNIQIEGKWVESEIDLVAYDESRIVLGECKYRNKMIGLKEFDVLKSKTPFIQTKGRKVYYLLASKSGFTEALTQHDGQNLILIHSE